MPPLLPTRQPGLTSRSLQNFPRTANPLRLHKSASELSQSEDPDLDQHHSLQSTSSNNSVRHHQYTKQFKLGVISYLRARQNEGVTLYMVAKRLGISEKMFKDW